MKFSDHFSGIDRLLNSNGIVRSNMCLYFPYHQLWAGPILFYLKKPISSEFPTKGLRFVNLIKKTFRWSNLDSSVDKKCLKIVQGTIYSHTTHIFFILYLASHAVKPEGLRAVSIADVRSVNSQKTILIHIPGKLRRNPVTFSERK